jgi:hypothetical protein
MHETNGKIAHFTPRNTNKLRAFQLEQEKGKNMSDLSRADKSYAVPAWLKLP